MTKCSALEKQALVVEWLVKCVFYRNGHITSFRESIKGGCQVDLDPLPHIATLLWGDMLVNTVEVENIQKLIT